MISVARLRRAALPSSIGVEVGATLNLVGALLKWLSLSALLPAAVANILLTALLADGQVSKSELDFLREIKKEATSSVQMLDELIADCEKMVG